MELLKNICLFWSYLIGFGYFILIFKNLYAQKQISKEPDSFLKSIVLMGMKQDVDTKFYWRVVPITAFVVFLNYIV